MNILTFGVFDLLHIGHVSLFKRAKELVSIDCRLIVAIQDSDFIVKYKPDVRMVYSQEERLFMVQSIKYVDEVVVYQNVDIDIKNIDFDVWVKGPDQNHEGFKRAEQWCYENNKKVVVLDRTEGISSSELRLL